MVSSSKRARKRRLAQESLRRETSHSGHQMDPADLSEPDSDREEEEDHKVLFPPKVQDIVITPSSPGKVQAVLDCDIANMVKTLNGAIAAMSQDTARNSSSMITQPPTHVTPVIVPDGDVHLHRPSPEARQGYRPAAPNLHPICRINLERWRDRLADLWIGQPQWTFNSLTRMSCRSREWVTGSWKDGLVITLWIF